MNVVHSHLKEEYRRAMVSPLTGERARLGERELQTIEALCGPLKGTVMDIGCADRFIEPGCIARGLEYIGIDYDTVDLERHWLPRAQETVDFVISLAVVEHIYNAGHYMDEVHKVLKRGGMAFISAPNFRYDWKGFYDDPTHVRPFTPEGLKTLMELSGFTDVKTYPGLRCKPLWMYHGPFRFARAAWLPFRGDNTWAPECLKGRATSFFCVGKKP